MVNRIARCLKAFLYLISFNKTCQWHVEVKQVFVPVSRNDKFTCEFCLHQAAIWRHFSAKIRAHKNQNQRAESDCEHVHRDCEHAESDGEGIESEGKPAKSDGEHREWSLCALIMVFMSMDFDTEMMPYSNLHNCEVKQTQKSQKLPFLKRPLEAGYRTR